ncbi:PTS sugar transporter subunit IIA [Sphingomonas qomolangmaensis]|uniref:PTS sugar transporter subunit IIA n=1 Tax=Sphingomonas qomolangmaensis TaxID=2918765 RepID=A0ABY5L7J3_9SPHN|nr:PTS sugar transporter subunit IIA [Sphingomonas qomolangmaensis]UUL81941.1 PTS sugar transporter subunit IIA [Sphingomonas qomolangmaensis]
MNDRAGSPGASDLGELLTHDCVVSGVSVGAKKALFQQLAALAAERLGLAAKLVGQRLAAREKLGSTGFGGGIAIPHARIESLDRVRGMFVRLSQPVDFDAVDALPVDLVFLLLSPVDAGADHLKALARVSRLLRDRTLADKLRGAGSNDALFALLTGVENRDAA